MAGPMLSCRRGGVRTNFRDNAPEIADVPFDASRKTPQRPYAAEARGGSDQPNCRNRSAALCGGSAGALACRSNGDRLRDWGSRHQQPQARRRPCLACRLFSADRRLFQAVIGQRPRTALPFFPVNRTLGWCDDPNSGNYNRLVHLPTAARHETLWRDDGLYDLVIVLNYNIVPRRKGTGSAIFLHCARPDFAPTEGCIALRREDLRKTLAALTHNVVLHHQEIKIVSRSER